MMIGSEGVWVSSKRRLLLGGLLALVCALLAASGMADSARSALLPGTNGQIVYASANHGHPDCGGRTEIFKMDFDGSNKERLTFFNPNTEFCRGHFAFNPAWSPDGSKIAFTGWTGQWFIAVMNPNGSELQVVSTQAFPNSEVSWSPDGSKIAFASRQHGFRNPEIYVMDRDGSNPTRLTMFDHPDLEGDDINPAWAPFGSKIAFVSRQPGDNHANLYVMDAVDRDGNGVGDRLRRITNDEYRVSDIAWSPDGKKLAYQGHPHNGFRFVEALYVKDLSGGEPAKIAEQQVHNLSFSPDGTRLVYNAGNGTHDNIFTMLADGSGMPRNITADNDSLAEKDIEADWGTTNPRPAVVLTGPASGHALTGAVRITADAAAYPSVDHVEFWVDGQQVGADAEAPYETLWDTTASADGQATVEVRAFEASGDQSSDSKTYTVENNAAPPDTTDPTTGYSTLPTHNSNGWYNSNVTVTLEAQDETDGSGVDSITYEAVADPDTGGQNIASTTKTNDSNASPFSTSFSISTEGETTVYYYATDGAGNDETEKSFTVKLDKTAPGPVTDLAATPGDEEAGLSWTNPTGSDFDLVRILRSESGPATGPDPGPGQTQVYEGTGSSHTDTGLTNDTEYHYTAFARDEAGNWSEAASVSATPGAPDTEKPFVEYRYPEADQTDVDVLELYEYGIEVWFSEAMDPASITEETIFIEDGSSATLGATVEYDDTHDIAYLYTDDYLQEGEEYTVTVKGGPSGAEDLAGNELGTSDPNEADETWQFTTAAPSDETPPTVTINSPEDGAAYGLGEEVLADYSCEDEEGGSGIDSCEAYDDLGDFVDVGDPIDTSEAGTLSLTVYAYDVAGNEQTLTNYYDVLEPATFQEDDRNFADYGSVWNYYQDPNFSDGWSAYSNRQKDSATFKFKGTSVAWITSKLPDAGKTDVFLDGAKVATFDAYAPESKKQYDVAGFFKSGLTNKTHTLKLVNTGTRNAASSNTFTEIDRFVVNGTQNGRTKKVTGGTSYQENHFKVGFGPWLGAQNASASGKTFRQSKSKTESAYFYGFTGPYVKLVSAKGPTRGTASIEVYDAETDELVEEATPNLYAAAVEWQAKVRVDGLDPAREHYLQVTSADGKPVVVDAYEAFPFQGGAQLMAASEGGDKKPEKGGSKKGS